MVTTKATHRPSSVPAVARHDVGASVVVVAALCAVFRGAPQVWLMPVVGTVATLAALIDGRTLRIPNWLTGAGAMITAAVALPLVAKSVVSGRSMLLGSVVMGGPLLGSHAFSRSRTPGLGDVKLAFVLGASVGAVGPLAAYTAVVVSLVMGATMGVVHRRVSSDRGFPFGPAIAFATVVVLIVAGVNAPDGRWMP